MEVYKSSIASITYSEDHNCITQTIDSFLHTEELKKFQTSLIYYCKNKKASKIIADTTNLKVVRVDDVNWMTTRVVPVLAKCGVKHFAIVLPNDPFGEMAVKLFVESSSDINMEIFGDLPSAQKWIRRLA
jgi:hypothetical protein